VHHRALFHLGAPITRRTVDDPWDLLDHQLDVRPSSFVMENRNVLQANQGLEDLGRVGDNEGASCFLDHTSSLKHLRLILGDLERRGSPLKSEEPKKPRETAIPHTRPNAKRWSGARALRTRRADQRLDGGGGLILALATTEPVMVPVRALLWLDGQSGS
jgi:hypothetical protein